MLEQLFINLSNEKLQQFFNNCVFKSALDEYKEEGIDVGAITFADNRGILELIEGTAGILQVLDEQTLLGSKATDQQVVAKIIQAHEKNANFIKPKFPGVVFGVPIGQEVCSTQASSLWRKTSCKVHLRWRK